MATIYITTLFSSYYYLINKIYIIDGQSSRNHMDTQARLHANMDGGLVAWIKSYFTRVFIEIMQKPLERLKRDLFPSDFPQERFENVTKSSVGRKTEAKEDNDHGRESNPAITSSEESMQGKSLREEMMLLRLKNWHVAVRKNLIHSLYRPTLTLGPSWLLAHGY